MTELSQTERMALRRIINLLPAIEKQFGVGEYLDDDKIIKYVQPQPQPVATLCEAVESVLSYLQVGGDNGNPPLSKRISIMRHALAHERKRAVLVDAVVADARRYVRQWGEGTFAKYLVESVDALDAFDKGAENG